MSKIKRTQYLFIFIFSLFIFGCSSNDHSTIELKEDEINIKQAQLTDFLFKEISYLNIKIKQPLIENNNETEEGEIIITLPYTVSSLLLSLKSVNIDTDKYNVFPSIGTQVIFSETEFIKYKITSKNNNQKSLHYNIKVIITDAPDEEKLSLLIFGLLSDDNSAYTNIDLTLKSKNQTVDSLLVCLFPKSVNFSNLVPWVEYKGSKIEYRINDDNFSEYPIKTGKSINFKYPNTVDFKISNTKNTKSIIYRIIVDTQHPILFNQSKTVTPNLLVGVNYNEVGVGTWTNQGNYPISTMTPNEYKNTKTPTAGLNNIFKTTLSKNSGGNINPNEDGLVNVIVTDTQLAGTYETTAVFNLNFNENSWKIVNSPTDNYIRFIGYKNTELKIKGTITN